MWGVWVGLIAPRTPGLIWVRGVVAGDEMVDGSLRGRRLRPLGLLWSAATPGGSRSTIWELVGSVGISGWWGRGGDRAKRSGDGGERVGPEVAQDVEAAAGELARDRHRGAGVREAIRRQRQPLPPPPSAGRGRRRLRGICPMFCVRSG